MPVITTLGFRLGTTPMRSAFCHINDFTRWTPHRSRSLPRIYATSGRVSAHNTDNNPPASPEFLNSTSREVVADDAKDACEHTTLVNTAENSQPKSNAEQAGNHAPRSLKRKRELPDDGHDSDETPNTDTTTTVNIKGITYSVIIARGCSHVLHPVYTDYQWPECPPCRVTKLIDDLTQYQREFWRRGGVFDSKPQPVAKSDDSTTRAVKKARWTRHSNILRGADTNEAANSLIKKHGTSNPCWRVTRMKLANWVEECALFKKREDYWEVLNGVIPPGMKLAAQALDTYKKRENTIYTTPGYALGPQPFVETGVSERTRRNGMWSMRAYRRQYKTLRFYDEVLVSPDHIVDDQLLTEVKAKAFDRVTPATATNPYKRLPMKTTRRKLDGERDTVSRKRRFNRTAAKGYRQGEWTSDWRRTLQPVDTSGYLVEKWEVWEAQRAEENAELDKLERQYKEEVDAQLDAELRNAKYIQEQQRQHNEDKRMQNVLGLDDIREREAQSRPEERRRTLALFR